MARSLGSLGSTGYYTGQRRTDDVKERFRKGAQLSVCEEMKHLKRKKEER